MRHVKKKHGEYLKYQVHTSAEVAAMMGNITASGVDKLTTSALKKLRRSPTLYLLLIESTLERSRRTNNLGTLAPDES